jgi:Sulfatase
MTSLHLAEKLGAIGSGHAARSLKRFTNRRNAMRTARGIWLGLFASIAAVTVASTPAAAQKKPSVVMLMSDDVGWGDYGVYYGGAALGHPTPNIDRIAKEGAVFTSWYGQASCTAGRVSSACEAVRRSGHDRQTQAGPLRGLHSRLDRVRA